MENLTVTHRERLDIAVKFVEAMLADGYRVNVPAAMNLADNLIAASGLELPEGLPAVADVELDTSRQKVMPMQKIKANKYTGYAAKKLLEAEIEDGQPLLG